MQDPYRIWLSEIMLQQTQVETVIPYFHRFLERFPTVQALAAAPQETVMALWSGLGYYARARNLHRAAQMVVDTYQGRFPPNAEGLLTLPGIGRSTAAAIAAFAYGERAAILDGNVKRVLCRVFGITGFPGEKNTEKALWDLAESLLPETDMAAYTQGQMDLGATVCTRSKPQCAICPMQTICDAYATDRVHLLPTRRPTQARPVRTWHFLVVEHADTILLTQRPTPGIWGGLWSLPCIPEPISAPQKASDWLQTQIGLVTTPGAILPALTHNFTHFQLTLLPQRYTPVSPDEHMLPPDWRWVQTSTLADIGIPTPIRQILAKLKN